MCLLQVKVKNPTLEICFFQLILPWCLNFKKNPGNIDRLSWAFRTVVIWGTSNIVRARDILFSITGTETFNSGNRRSKRDPDRLPQYLPQQAVLGPYFLNDFSASLPPKHCPPFCTANITRPILSAASAHFVSAFTRFL